MAAASVPAASNDVLAVHLNGRPYAFPLALVLDVCRAIPTTTLPGAPPHVLGMGAWRGRLIPCIGLHRLGVAAVEIVQRQFVMVILRLSDGEVALAVEGPVEVVTPPAPPRESVGGAQPETAADAPAPPGASPVTTLDIERLLPRYNVGPAEARPPDGTPEGRPA